ncbi:MAG: hypothetical protein A2X49_01895 [Lentisphaerae bacterium GWF2_52_8]|nr:MAG: hypothetical protein A2X49_01895 [Lentisphaerae bacterium GWF2_52_8]
MLKAIFWDNDGVLVETEHLYYQACAGALAEAGVTLSEEAFVDFSLRQGRSIFELLKNTDGNAPDEALISRLALLRNELYAKLLRQSADCLVLPGVRELLSCLKGRYRMGIVTSCRREHFTIMHEKTGLLGYFDFVIGEGDYKKYKPDPEPYLNAVGRSGCLPGECLAIEDSERGLRSAVAAGLRCIAVPRGLSAGGDFTVAEAILSDISEILPKLSGF